MDKCNESEESDPFIATLNMLHIYIAVSVISSSNYLGSLTVTHQSQMSHIYLAGQTLVVRINPNDAQQVWCLSFI